MKIKFNPIRFILVFSLILLLMYLYNHFGIKDMLTKEKITSYLIPFGNWIPLIYLGIFIIAMVLYVPASVFLITIGSILDPLWGSIFGLLGCYLSSVILFLIARKFNLKSIENKLGKRWVKFNEKIQEDGFFYIALIRSTSLFPFSVIGYASGITSIKLKDYIKGTVIGCIPQIIIYCYIIPMVLTGQVSTEKIINVIIITFAWLALFGTAYNYHRKAKLENLIN